jgi:DNA-binding MarR family transcriptional regulator
VDQQGVPSDALDPASPDPAHWPVGRLLSSAARRVERDWNAHLASWDLNHASHAVLAHLLRSPMSQRELATASAVTEQTMSRVLARMERSEYITRTPHDDDRRRHVITITDAGRSAFFVASDRELAASMVTRGLTPEQAEQLRQLLVVVARERRADADHDRTAGPAG